ncbi:RASAL1 [Symbiodinium sp. CCMP2592]|nr:RASAL1 [Symbiodinium sp. CCMP2592]
MGKKPKAEAPWQRNAKDHGYGHNGQHGQGYSLWHGAWRSAGSPQEPKEPRPRPRFPSYDQQWGAEPHLRVIREERVEAPERPETITAKGAQQAVNILRKAESRVTRIQKERKEKAARFSDYEQQLMTAFMEERQRHTERQSQLVNELEEAQKLLQVARENMAQTAQGLMGKTRMDVQDTSAEDWAAMITKYSEAPVRESHTVDPDMAEILRLATDAGENRPPIVDPGTHGPAHPTPTYGAASPQSGLFRSSPYPTTSPVLTKAASKWKLRMAQTSMYLPPLRATSALPGLFRGTAKPQTTGPSLQEKLDQRREAERMGTAMHPFRLQTDNMEKDAPRYDTDGNRVGHQQEISDEDDPGRRMAGNSPGLAKLEWHLLLDMALEHRGQPAHCLFVLDCPPPPASFIVESLSVFFYRYLRSLFAKVGDPERPSFEGVCLVLAPRHQSEVLHLTLRPPFDLATFFNAVRDRLHKLRLPFCTVTAPTVPQLGPDFASIVVAPKWIPQVSKQVVVYDFRALGGPVYADITHENLSHFECLREASHHGFHDCSIYAQGGSRALEPGDTILATLGCVIQFQPTGTPAQWCSTLHARFDRPQWWLVHPSLPAEVADKPVLTLYHDRCLAYSAQRFPNIQELTDVVYRGTPCRDALIVLGFLHLTEMAVVVFGYKPDHPWSTDESLGRGPERDHPTGQQPGLAQPSTVDGCVVHRFGCTGAFATNSADAWYQCDRLASTFGPPALFVGTSYICGILLWLVYWSRASGHQAKLLAEPACRNRAERRNLRRVRHATRFLGGHWITDFPFRHPGFDPTLLDDWNTSDSEPEAELTTVPCAILRVEYTPEHLIVAVPVPTTQEEAIEAIQAVRQHDSGLDFPNLLSVLPQPALGVAVFAALPPWASGADIVCLDTTKIDGRLFLAQVPQYCSKHGLIRSAGLLPGLDYEVLFGVDQVPREDDLVHLFPGALITFLHPGQHREAVPAQLLTMEPLSSILGTRPVNGPLPSARTVASRPSVHPQVANAKGLGNAEASSASLLDSYADLMLPCTTTPYMAHPRHPTQVTIRPTETACGSQADYLTPKLVGPCVTPLHSLSDRMTPARSLLSQLQTLLSPGLLLRRAEALPLEPDYRIESPRALLLLLIPVPSSSLLLLLHRALPPSLPPG